MASVVIYTKSWCPYCSAAKDLLQRKGVAFQEIEITGRSDLRDEMVERAAGRTTVPQIFIGDVHVGGYDDMMALHRAGRLKPLLEGGVAP